MRATEGVPHSLRRDCGFGMTRRGLQEVNIASFTFLQPWFLHQPAQWLLMRICGISRVSGEYILPAFIGDFTGETVSVNINVFPTLKSIDGKNGARR
jgi:hypothetical protein